ncbi:uncharacterized protein LOC108678919 [Hyalella azteca]|uniref:Uncharacterized protein LOC108678919 n=1 Tax=Hyalella azteca TaxID=294128 RepID=A0A8B7PAA0_HYAAZ|nr:uncharacterized protein LOC108678919 [Hyalella azteca]
MAVVDAFFLVGAILPVLALANSQVDTKTYVAWRTGVVVYKVDDLCFLGTLTQTPSSGTPAHLSSATLYAADYVESSQVTHVNTELKSNCTAGSTWWLTATRPQLPTLIDYLHDYRNNKTKHQELPEDIPKPRVRRSSGNSNPSDRLRRRLHDLTQRLAPNAAWTTIGAAETRGRVQLTNDPYPSPLFSRQPNGQRFKHYRAFYDEIARQASSNPQLSNTSDKQSLNGNFPIQRYSLRVNNQPSSHVRLKSKDGPEIRPRSPRRRLRSQQSASRNMAVTNRISNNDKRNVDYESYDSENESDEEEYDENEHSDSHYQIPRRSQRLQNYESNNRRELDTTQNRNELLGNSLIFSQAHGSAGPDGSFQAESRGTGQSGESTQSAVNGGARGASASSSAVRFNQQALAHVNVSPTSSRRAQTHEAANSDYSETSPIISASEIEGIMRSNGYTGLAMASVTSRKKERGRNKVKPLSSLGLSVAGYPSDAGNDNSNTQVNSENRETGDVRVPHVANRIIDYGGLIGGTGSHHRESEFEQINQGDNPEGGLNRDGNEKSVGLATYAQGTSGYPSSDYTDAYYDFERYGHNPPLDFPDDYNSIDYQAYVDNSFASPDSSANAIQTPGRAGEAIDSGVNHASPGSSSHHEAVLEQNDPYVANVDNSLVSDQERYPYFPGIPYGQDIISNHQTGTISNPEDISLQQPGEYEQSVHRHPSNVHPGHEAPNLYDQNQFYGQGNQVLNEGSIPNETGVGNDESSYIHDNGELSSQTINNGMMIVDDSLQSYFIQPPDVEFPNSENAGQFSVPDHVLDYDIHSRRTSSSSSHPSYDFSSGADSTLPVDVVESHYNLEDGGIHRIENDHEPVDASDNEVWDHRHSGPSIQSSALPRYDQPHHQGAKGRITPPPDRKSASSVTHYPPGHRDQDKQPASQGIDNSYSRFNTENYPRNNFPATAVDSADSSQSLPHLYDNQPRSNSGNDAGEKSYEPKPPEYDNTVSSGDFNYETDDYTSEIQPVYNTSHSVYSSSHHYSYQRGSDERGIGSSSDTVLVPATISTEPPQPHVTQAAGVTANGPYQPVYPLEVHPEPNIHTSRTDDNISPGGQGMEMMRPITPGSIGTMHSIPASDPSIADVKVVMAAAPSSFELNNRQGTVLTSGEKIPGTTGYIVPSGFRGRLILGNFGVSSTSEAQMMPGVSSQAFDPMQGMQMRVSSSSSARSGGSGISLSSSSSSSAFPQGMLTSSSSSASNSLGGQTNSNYNKQPVYSYQQTLHSNENGGPMMPGSPDSHQMRWQQGTPGIPGMRSKSWSSWRTTSWSNGEPRAGVPQSGQYSSQSAFQPSPADCGYWSMQCYMVQGPFQQNELCRPTQHILPCCC